MIPTLPPPSLAPRKRSPLDILLGSEDEEQFEPITPPPVPQETIDDLPSYVLDQAGKFGVNAGTSALSALGTAAHILDTPGRGIRRALVGANPFGDEEVYGRDILEAYGLADEERHPGVFTSPEDTVADIGGFAIDVLTDPFTYTGFGPYTKLGWASKMGAPGRAAAKKAIAAADDAARHADFITRSAVDLPIGKTKLPGVEVPMTKVPNGAGPGTRVPRATLDEVTDAAAKAARDKADETLREVPKELLDAPDLADTWGNAIRQKQMGLVEVGLPFSWSGGEGLRKSLVYGTGENAAKVADALGAPYRALRGTWGGRQLAKILDPAVQDADTLAGQQVASDAFHAADRGRAEAVERAKVARDFRDEAVAARTPKVEPEAPPATEPSPAFAQRLPLDPADEPVFIPGHGVTTSRQLDDDISDLRFVDELGGEQSLDDLFKPPRTELGVDDTHLRLDDLDDGQVARMPDKDQAAMFRAAKPVDPLDATRQTPQVDEDALTPLYTGQPAEPVQYFQQYPADEGPIVEAITKEVDSYRSQAKAAGLPFDEAQATRIAIADYADQNDMATDAVRQAFNSARGITETAPPAGFRKVNLGEDYMVEELVDEARKTPKVWTLAHNTDGDGYGVLTFTTKGGNEYKVAAAKDGDKTDIVFTDAMERVGITGAGNAAEVLRNATDAIVSYVKSQDPKVLTFSAEEPSRRRLYDRIVKTVAKSLPGYKAAASDDDIVRNYIIAKAADFEDALAPLEVRMAYSRSGTPLYDELAQLLPDELAGEVVGDAAHTARKAEVQADLTGKIARINAALGLPEAATKQQLDTILRMGSPDAQALLGKRAELKADLEDLLSKKAMYDPSLSRRDVVDDVLRRQPDVEIPLPSPKPAAEPEIPIPPELEAQLKRELDPERFGPAPPIERVEELIAKGPMEPETIKANFRAAAEAGDGVEALEDMAEALDEVSRAKGGMVAEAQAARQTIEDRIRKLTDEVDNYPDDGSIEGLEQVEAALKAEKSKLGEVDAFLARRQQAPIEATTSSIPPEVRTELAKKYKGQELEDNIAIATPIVQTLAKQQGVSEAEMWQRILPGGLKTYAGRYRGKLAQEGGVVGGIFDAAKKMIGLYRDAKPTTFVHEFGHAILPHLDDASKGLLETEARKMLGAVDDAGWDRAFNEWHSESWENYIATGRAPTPQLQGVFERMKELFSKFIETIKTLLASKGGKRYADGISPETEQIFAGLMNPETAQQILKVDVAKAEKLVPDLPPPAMAAQRTAKKGTAPELPAELLPPVSPAEIVVNARPALTVESLKAAVTDGDRITLSELRAKFPHLSKAEFRKAITELSADPANGIHLTQPSLEGSATVGGRGQAKEAKDWVAIDGEKFNAVIVDKGPSAPTASGTIFDAAKAAGIDLNEADVRYLDTIIEEAPPGKAFLHASEGWGPVSTLAGRNPDAVKRYIAEYEKNFGPVTPQAAPVVKAAPSAGAVKLSPERRAKLRADLQELKDHRDMAAMDGLTDDYQRLDSEIKWIEKQLAGAKPAKPAATKQASPAVDYTDLAEEAAHAAKVAPNAPTYSGDFPSLKAYLDDLDARGLDMLDESRWNLSPEHQAEWLAHTPETLAKQVEIPASLADEGTPPIPDSLDLGLDTVSPQLPAEIARMADEYRAPPASLDLDLDTLKPYGDDVPSVGSLPEIEKALPPAAASDPDIFRDIPEELLGSSDDLLDELPPRKPITATPLEEILASPKASDDLLKEFNDLPHSEKMPYWQPVSDSIVAKYGNQRVPPAVFDDAKRAAAYQWANGTPVPEALGGRTAASKAAEVAVPAALDTPAPASVVNPAKPAAAPKAKSVIDMVAGKGTPAEQQAAIKATNEVLAENPGVTGKKLEQLAADRMAGKTKPGAKAPPLPEEVGGSPKTPFDGGGSAPPPEPPLDEVAREALPPAASSNFERVARRFAEGVKWDDADLKWIGDEPQKFAKDLEEKFINPLREMTEEGLDYGIVSPLNDVVDYFPRSSSGAQAKRFGKTGLAPFWDRIVAWMKGSKQTVAKGKRVTSVQDYDDFAREAHLSGWRDGTDGLNEAVRTWAGDADSNDMRNWLEKRLSDKTTELKDGTQITKDKRIEKAAKFLSELPAELKGDKAPAFFDRSVVDDLHVGLQRLNKKVSSASAIFKLFATEGGDEGLGMIEALRKAGIKTGKQTETSRVLERMLKDNSAALSKKGISSIADLEKLKVPEEFVADALRILKSHDDPEYIKPLLEAWDKGTDIFRTSATILWPANWARNFLSGQYVNLVSGGFSPAAFGEAVNIVQGKPSKYWDEMVMHSVLDPKAGHRGYGSTHGSTVSDLLDKSPMTPKDLYNKYRDEAKLPGPLGSWEAGGHAAAGTVEALNRATHYIARRQQGYAPYEAAQETLKAHFDYARGLTTTERKVVRRIVPFYSFAKLNLPWHLEQLVRHPGGAVAQSIRATDTARRDTVIPPWMEGKFAMALGPSGDGESFKYISGLGLPFEEAFERYYPGDIPRTIQAHLGMAHPAIKMPLELAAGKQFFSGRDLDSLQPWPTGNQVIDQAIFNSPASRAVSTARTLTDERKGLAEKLLNIGTGVKVTDVDMARAAKAAQREDLLRLLEASPNVQGRRVYSARKGAELTPEEQAALKEYRGTGKAGKKSSVSVKKYRDNPDGTTTHFLSDGTEETVRLVPQADGSMAVYDLQGRRLSG